MSQEINYQDVQKTILQAITIRSARLTHHKDKTPDDFDHPLDTMTDNLGKALVNLLKDDTKEHQDWDNHLWSMAHFLQSLLVCFAQPDALKSLPKYHRKEAAEKINKLIFFFTSVQTERVNAFLDFQYCGYGADDEELKRINNYYDFAQRGEHQYHSHFFGDYYREKEYLDNETFFFKKNYKQ